MMIKKVIGYLAVIITVIHLTPATAQTRFEALGSTEHTGERTGHKEKSIPEEAILFKAFSELSISKHSSSKLLPKDTDSEETRPTGEPGGSAFPDSFVHTPRATFDPVVPVPGALARPAAPCENLRPAKTLLFHETLFFKDLAHSITTVRDDGQKLYDFLSSDACKKFPFLLVVGYIKLLDIDLDMRITFKHIPGYSMPLVFRTSYDTDPRVFAVLKAAGVNEESADSTKRKLKHVDKFREKILLPAQELIDKQYSDDAQKQLLDYYCTEFKKLSPEQRTKKSVLNVIDDIFLVQEALPYFCRIITPALVTHYIKNHDLAYVHDQKIFEAVCTSSTLIVCTNIMKTVEMLLEAGVAPVLPSVPSSVPSVEKDRIDALLQERTRLEQELKALQATNRLTETKKEAPKAVDVKVEVKREGFEAALVDPETLLIKSLANTLDDHRENPEQLYAYLKYISENRKYSIFLVIAYMRILDIDPNQMCLRQDITRKSDVKVAKVLPPMKVGGVQDAGKDGACTQAPLLFRAVDDQNMFIYTTLKYLGAYISQTDSQGKKIEELGHCTQMALQFDSIKLNSVKNICALVDYYLDYYVEDSKKLRSLLISGEVTTLHQLYEHRGELFLEIITELFAIKSELPILLATVTPALIIERLRAKEITIVIADRYKEKYKTNRQVLELADRLQKL